MDVPVSIWIGLGLVWVAAIVVLISIRGRNIPDHLWRRRSMTLEDTNLLEGKEPSGAWKNPFDVDVDRQIHLGARPYKSRIK